MKRSFYTWAFVLFLAFLSAGTASGQSGDCWQDSFGREVCSDTDAGGFGYRYDGATQTFFPDEALGGTETSGGVRIQLRYVVNCAGNTVDDPVTVGECSTSACMVPDGSPGVSYQVYQRPEGAADWTLRPGTVCRDVGVPIPLEDVEAEIIRIIEAHFQQVAKPEITVQPATNAVVNLPVLASTPDPGPIGFDITNPLPGRVEATPTYEWTWSNGQQSTGSGVGYDGTSPTGDPGHYPVQTTYVSGGSGSVGLTVTWSITLTVAGIPPITDIPPLEYSASADFPVRSAGTVLVDSPG